LLFFLVITHRCDVPDSWAAQHTTEHTSTVAEDIGSL